jgi:hypothetical protein
MVGKASSAIGLVIGGVVTIILGFSLTLMAYQDAGPVTFFYYGRYYGGIAGMAIGAVLILAGILLPILWPTERGNKQPQAGEKMNLALKERPQEPVHPEPRSPVARSVERKIRGVSMQSTCGKEAIQILRLLSSQNLQITPEQMILETGTDRERLIKAIKLLADLDLIERSNSGNEAVYKISSALRSEVSQVLGSLYDQRT